MNGLKETLIHPIADGAYKEQMLNDFVSREEFINKTGIFVSPDFFNYIYDMEFKESGVSADEFIRDYEEKYSTCIQEVPLNGTFKYEVMDDTISCFNEYDDSYEPNIWEIINVLSMSYQSEFQAKYDVMEKLGHLPEDFEVLVKILPMLRLEVEIINGLLEQIINNKTCATEIVENQFLKDIWNISFNQLEMINKELNKKMTATIKTDIKSVCIETKEHTNEEE